MISYKMPNQKIKISELHPNEKWLISKWRNEYRFSKLTISIQNGIPQGIEEGITKERPSAKKEIIKDHPL